MNYCMLWKLHLLREIWECNDESDIHVSDKGTIKGITRQESF